MKKRHFDCTIMRTVEVSRFTWNIVTGEKKFISKETVTEPCGTPLFSKDDEINGICSSCADGWETEGNVFANDAERERAKTKFKRSA